MTNKRIYYVMRPGTKVFISISMVRDTIILESIYIILPILFIFQNIRIQTIPKKKDLSFCFPKTDFSAEIRKLKAHRKMWQNNRKNKLRQNKLYYYTWIFYQCYFCNKNIEVGRDKLILLSFPYAKVLRKRCSYWNNYFRFGCLNLWYPSENRM